MNKMQIFAFFSYKIKVDGQDAATKRVDLIVLENMFPPTQFTITRRFDLKGIKTRGSKAQETNKEKTLWDQEWLESYRALLLIYPHSKRVIQGALLCVPKSLNDSGQTP
jgi:uncharacterized protein YajQ (UPF0234 family)